ncbi:hypothetical protein IFM89_027612 [Coptis chinensis]|uniref:DYW domain-containing protein n=1 Tax=Coptis chinensis TaxID=261450 RepID=A0A835M6Q6_9MAGN|nr:hypothetical protein IFM89_027612 [Coptis chinensis]
MNYDYRSLLLVSAVVRVCLIIYGEWQDSHMEVRYTDVDYLVFSDASSLMATGMSPYKRSTYRYSPLLAFILLPNSFIHASWGKLLFSASDLLVGLFIRIILKLRGVPENLCLISMGVWLFNPFTFTIGTRGNCKVLQAAFWYGLVVHFRIYPIIYALPILLVLKPHNIQSGSKPYLQNWTPSQQKSQQSYSGEGLVRISDSWLLLRIDGATGSHIPLRTGPPFLLFGSNGSVCSIQQGYNSAVFCVVLLPVAPCTSMEYYDSQMGRHLLHSHMDGCSDPLADVGLSAGVQRQKCLCPVVVCRFIVLGCEHMGSRRVNTSSQVLSSFPLVRENKFQEWKKATVMEQYALGDLAVVRPGRAIHGHIVCSGFSSDVPITTALVGVYSKSGSLDAAYEVFVELNNPDKIAWTSMLAAHAMHGHGRKAIDCFDLMVSKGISPDHVTFTHLLNACSHSGLIEEGKKYFEDMSKVYGVEPKVDHYSCMVDLLGRSGLLEEAWKFIESMPIEPNAGVWGALVGACRIHSNINFGKEAAERLLVLDPLDPRNYIILSNIYSSAGQWKEASVVRALMRERGLKKDRSSSCIEHGGKVYRFVVADQSHPDSKEIYLKLGEVITKMQNAGYVCNTEYVLHDVDEVVKEDMIYKHSEKLAIAFGLLVSGAGMPIMITNNLRICGDCHSARKFISLVENRTITIRDSKRFHHFANGFCSCQDYW